MAKHNHEHLSDHLRATRNRIAEFRHGGIYLNDEEVEKFVRRLDQLTNMARELEGEIGRRQWSERTSCDLDSLIDAAFGDNVVAFPGRPDHRPTGGSAA
jgi:hypothetical protein